MYIETQAGYKVPLTEWFEIIPANLRDGEWVLARTSEAWGEGGSVVPDDIHPGVIREVEGQVRREPGKAAAAELVPETEVET